jgi:hypothetical protein
MPFELSDAEAVAFCKEVASAVDRIADGRTLTTCLELPWTNDEGERLVFVATIDPELWPRLQAAVKAHLNNQRERRRIAAFAGQEQPAQNQEQTKPS